MSARPVRPQLTAQTSPTSLRQRRASLWLAGRGLISRSCNAAGQAFFALRAFKLHGRRMWLAGLLALAIAFNFGGRRVARTSLTFRSGAGLALCFKVGILELAGYSYLEVVVGVQSYVATA